MAANPKLSLIVTQFDRRRYPEAIEELIASTRRLQPIVTTLVVVDNGNEGDWRHHVTDRFFHIGGDNSAWEFSAFDRGVAFLEEIGHETDVFAFVTDAFQGYGTEYWRQLNPEGVAFAHNWQAAVGLVDSFLVELEALGLRYERYLRSSFLILPKAFYGKLAPLATALPEDLIWSGDPHQPFRPDAPISLALRERLLAWLTRSRDAELSESWHSSFTLNDTTLPLFEAKARAILREHLLSARLQQLGLPAYDLRSVLARDTDLPWLLGESIGFEVTRLAVPELVFPGGRFTLDLVGDLHLGGKLVEIEAKWLGEPCPAPTFAEREVEKGHRYQVEVFSSLLVPEHGVVSRFELIFRTERGGRFPWSFQPELFRADHTPHTVSLQEFGAADPMTGLTPVHVRGLLPLAEAGDHLQLSADGVPVLETAVAAAEPGRAAAFDLCGHARLAVGPNELLLALVRADGSSEKLGRFTQTIHLAQPTIALEIVEVLPLPVVGNHSALRLVGWVGHDSLVDRVEVLVDGELLASLNLTAQRADVARYLSQGLVRRQGFEAELPLLRPPGRYRLLLRAISRFVPAVEVTQELEVEPSPFKEVTLSCPTLEDAQEPTVFWSSLRLTGEVTGHETATVEVVVDGIAGEAVKLSPGRGAFTLSYREAPAEFLWRLRVVSAGSVIYESADRRGKILPFAPTAEVCAALGTIINFFGMRSRFGASAEMVPAEILAEKLLAEFAAPQALSDVFDLVLRVAPRLTTAAQEPLVADHLERANGRRLKILFVSWETVGPRHGGGSALFHLLRQLGRRHDITLIHCPGKGEADFEAELRPLVDRVVTVRKYHRSASAIDPLLPSQYVDNHTPALRATIEYELAAHSYDLVNYEYTTLFSHVPAKSAVPRLLVVHELGLLTRFDLAHLRERDPGTVLEDFLRYLHFYADRLPAVCPTLVSLTPEEGALMQRLAPQAWVIANTIGVDTQLFQPPERRTNELLFVFVGNYRHPPNRPAVRQFAEEVLPRVRARFPEARFAIVGADPPAEIQKLSELPGVEVTGFVSDVRPYLERARAFVAPLKEGRGMRVKLLEAMACGIPVIGTRLALAGFAAEKDRDYREAESVDDFVEACCDLAGNPDLAWAIGAAGRGLVETKHNIEAAAANREAIWARLIAKRPH